MKRLSLILLFLLITTSCIAGVFYNELLKDDLDYHVGTLDTDGNLKLSNDLTVCGNTEEERITGTEYQEYIDFNDHGDGKITIGGDGGTDDTDLIIDLDGTMPRFESFVDDALELGEDTTIDGSLSIGNAVSGVGTMYYLVIDITDGSVYRSGVTFSG